MVTGRCPLDGTPSNPSSCWVDVSVDEDGNVRTTIPLPLGYNLIDWVAADRYGNLPRDNAIPRQVRKETQLIYVAPTVVLNGVTDLILLEVGSTGTGSFDSAVWTRWRFYKIYRGNFKVPSHVAFL